MNKIVYVCIYIHFVTSFCDLGWLCTVNVLLSSST